MEKQILVINKKGMALLKKEITSGYKTFHKYTDPYNLSI